MIYRDLRKFHAAKNKTNQSQFTELTIDPTNIDTYDNKNTESGFSNTIIFLNPWLYKI